MLTSTRPSSTHPKLSLVDADQAEALLSNGLDVRWPGGGSPSAVHIERVWPMGDGALAAEWSLRLADGERCSVQVMPLDSRGVNARSSARSSHEPTLRDGVLYGLHVVLPEHGLEIHSMDHDSELTLLPECLDPLAMGRRLACDFSSVGTRRNEASETEVRPLSYRARRRATIRYRQGQQRLVGKVFRDDRGERVALRHFTLRERLIQDTGGRVTVPAPIRYLPDLRMLLLGWNEPRELPAAGAPTDELWRVLGALRALHGSAMENLPVFSHGDEIAVVERWVKTLATLDAGGTDTIRRLVPIWRVRTPPTQRCVTVHRDFYSRQVLLGANKTTLIDLDTLSSGDAAVDVGNFLAHRWLDALQHAGPAAAEGFEHHARETLVAYQASGGRLRGTHLRWYWASALLRLGAVHAPRTMTGRFSETLWALAAELIGATRLLSGVENDPGCGSAPLPSVETILAEVRE